MTRVIVQGKVIGEFEPELNQFVKRVSLSKHLFRIFDAWGIDLRYFESELLPRNATIRVHETEEKKLYEIEAVTMKQKGIEHEFGNFGRQLFLPRSEWIVYDLDTGKQVKNEERNLFTK